MCVFILYAEYKLYHFAVIVKKCHFVIGNNVNDFLICEKFLQEIKLLRSVTKVWQGNVFTSVCQEFCPQGRICQTPPGPEADTPPDQRQTPHKPEADTPQTRGKHPPWTRGRHPQTRGWHPPQPEADTPTKTRDRYSLPRRDSHYSRWYASYWNALLFLSIISL